MYKVQIKIEDKINTFTIKELKELKSILENFKKVDSIDLRKVKEKKYE